MSKIKMTKAIPTEVGDYYWSRQNGDIPEIGIIVEDGQFYIYDEYCTTSILGGYWAKVDPSIFEFDD